MGGHQRSNDKMARSLGLHDAPSLVTQTLRTAQVTMTRVSVGAELIGTRPALPAEDVFLATVYLTEVPHHQLWRGGRAVISRCYARNALEIVNLSAQPAIHIASPYEAVRFYIPRAAMDESMGETASPRAVDLVCPPGIVDPVMAQLTSILLPAFEQPAEMTPLFVDCIARAVIAHLMHRYGRPVEHKPVRRGGLSLLQQQRAKDYIAGNLTSDIRISDVAKICGLSRGHFIRAFRETTGSTPHRWLQKHRIKKAKSLLLETCIPIAEIAILCGFADQSHLTKVFTLFVGESPSAWRREHQGATMSGASSLRHIQMPAQED